MQNNKSESIMSLRSKIYFLESNNNHKEYPQTDAEMIDRIIREVKKAVEQEEVNYNVDRND